MRASQVLYIFLIIGIIAFIIKSTDILDDLEGFQNVQKSEPVIAPGLESVKLETKTQPNPSIPGTLPFAPYGQAASVGSYQYQDPAQLPANLQQIKRLYEDIRSFLVFEGTSVSNSSDPTVSLPLTQLRSDSRRLQQEVAVLNKNPGIQSSLTQQELADIEGALTFLQRKIRLFQTAGVVSDGVEGFVDAAPKTKATKLEIQLLQNKIYAAILTLSASGTTDPVVKARIKNLQGMYSETGDILSKLDKGIMKPDEVPYYSQDIRDIIPKLASPNSKLIDLAGQGDGQKLSVVEQQLGKLVGDENAKSVFKDIRKNGMFRVNFGVDLGYNVKNEETDKKVNKKDIVVLSKQYNMDQNGLIHDDTSNNSPGMSSINPTASLSVDGPFDSTMSGMDDRAEVIKKATSPSRLDWEKRAKDICQQVKLRGLDPLDFGCISEGSKMSPAYSWRGHTKMICGRLGATMDPSLPATCGCPPANWKGWTLADCLSGPPGVGGELASKKCKN
jgi:hypothetical protein